MGIHWFIIITVVVLFVQRVIYTRWGLHNIHYERYFDVETVFEGEEVNMVERISNRKLLPVPWLRLESRIDSSLRFQKQTDLDIKHGEYHKSLFSLSPYRKITRRHRIKCTKRGFYPLNSAVITCGDAFESEEVCRNIDLSSSLLVYPKPVPIEEVPLPTHNWLGDIVVRRWIIEDPFMILGVREYRYGDPLNRINWKATAHSGKLQVHNLDHTSDPHLMIYLNVDESENMLGPVTNPDMIERGITYAASIAHHAISKGIEAGFGSNGYIVDHPRQVVRVLPRSGTRQLTVLLEVMAKMVIAQSTTFSTFIEEDIIKGVTDRDFLFITCYVSEDMERQINKLRKLGNSVEIVRLTADDGKREEENYEDNVF